MNPFSRGENRLSKEGHSREVTGLMVAQTASSAGGVCAGWASGSFGQWEGQLLYGHGGRAHTGSKQ